jgi:hypothetical protein
MAAGSADPLTVLAGTLRAEDSVISAHVRDPGEAPEKLAGLGRLAGAGPRTEGDPGAYALVVESVREGYLLHYGEGRIVACAERDLALLAGDYLYALGLERLAGLGDLPAVRELSDLISLAAQIHDGSRDAAREAREAGALWLATVAAIAVDTEAAKARLRAGDEAAADALEASAREVARRAGAEHLLGEASDSINFR